MYCAACGTPMAAGLSFCNRCGMNLKERSESKTGLIGAYLTAITIVGVGGLILMIGGAIALTNGAHLGAEVVGVFMMMAFFIICLVEIFLCRQLSRISKASEIGQFISPATHASMPAEFRTPQPRALAEPPTSVTENTTRTLEYSRHEPSN